MSQNTYRLRLGRMIITILSDGTMHALAEKMFYRVKKAEWSQFVETDDKGRMVYGSNIMHVSVDGHSILLDTGLGEPHPSRGRFERAFPITQSSTTTLLLESIGVSPRDISIVVLSHAHADHIMGTTVERDGKRIPVFPNARHLLTEVEWRECPARLMRRPTMFTLHLPILQREGLLDLVQDGHEVVKGMRMLLAAGETPGHAVVRMEDAGKVLYYVGDLFNHPAEVARPQWMAPGRDGPTMLASRQSLLKRAVKEDAALISAHILFPGLGRVRQAKDSFEWVAADAERGLLLG